MHRVRFGSLYIRYKSQPNPNYSSNSVVKKGTVETFAKANTLIVFFAVKPKRPCC